MFGPCRVGVNSLCCSSSEQRRPASVLCANNLCWHSPERVDDQQPPRTLSALVAARCLRPDARLDTPVAGLGNSASCVRIDGVSTTDIAAPPDASPSTRQEKAQATRRRLLAVGVELFAERPFHQVQVSEIAEKAGVAHGVLFHHFGSKRGLYVEAVNELSKVLFELPEPEPGASPGERIRQILYEHFHRVATNERLVVGYIKGSLGIASDPQAWEVLENRRLTIISDALEIVGMDPTATAPRITLRAISAGMDQLSVEWVQQGRSYPIDAVVEAMIHIMVGALRGACELDPSLDTSAAESLLRPRP